MNLGQYIFITWILAFSTALMMFVMNYIFVNAMHWPHEISAVLTVAVGMLILILTAYKVQVDK